MDTVGEGELLWNLVVAEGTDNEAIAGEYGIYYGKARVWNINKKMRKQGRTNSNTEQISRPARPLLGFFLTGLHEYLYFLRAASNPLCLGFH